MSTSSAQIASAAAAVKGQDERAAKTSGAPLTAASLRLGGSYGELPLPFSQKRGKSLRLFALQAIFRPARGHCYTPA